MLQGIFRGTSPGIIMIVVILSLFLWMGAFIEPVPLPSAVYETTQMPLYSVLRFIAGDNPYKGLILTVILFSLMLFLMVNFNTRVFFINERTFLPAFIYLFLVASIPDNQVMNPVLPASLLLMAASYRIMDAYRKPGTAYNFFDAGVLISMGSLFYANLIWFGILVIIGIALLRSGDLREIIAAIAGLITPWAVVVAIYYICGWNVFKLFEIIGSNLFSRAPEFHFGIFNLVVLLVTGIVILVSLGFLVTRMNTKKIKSRKTFSLLIWVFLISVGVYILVPSASVEIMWLIAIPAGYFLTHYFIFSPKKLIPEIIFPLFLLLVLLIQVMRIF